MQIYALIMAMVEFNLNFINDTLIKCDNINSVANCKLEQKLRLLSEMIMC